MKVEELIGKNVVVSKLEAIRYKEGHPNGVNVGYTKMGKLLQAEVGKSLVLGFPDIEGFKYIDSGLLFYTSTVLKIEEDLVYTKNSVYKAEEV